VKDAEVEAACLVPRCMMLASRLPLFAVQKQMLELIHEDMVAAFNKEFISLCS
jgi:hypothetical protein